MAIHKPFDIKSVRDQKRMYLRKVTINLATALTNEVYTIAGDFINVIKCAGNATIRLNEDTAPAIDVRTVETIKTPFYRFYVDSDGAQANGELILLVGTDAGFEFEERRSGYEVVADVTTTPAAGSSDNQGVDVAGYRKICIMMQSDKVGSWHINMNPLSLNATGAFWTEIEQIPYLRTSTSIVTRTIEAPIGGVAVAFLNRDTADAAEARFIILGAK